MNLEDKIRILLVDDHRLVREGLRALLECYKNLEVIGEAQDGTEALAQAVALRPDLIILDLSLPDIDGLTVLSRLRAGDQHVRILVLSMHSDAEYVLRAAQAGASGYLLKESLAGELYEAICQVMRHGPSPGSFYLSGKLASKRLRALLRSRIGAESSAHVELLTPRERAVLRLIAEGLTNKEIAVKLGISVKTVETHRMHLLRKLAAHSTADLVRYAVERGLIDYK